MYCPFCENPNTNVVDSRVSKRGYRRRRRECAECGGKFVTEEFIRTVLPRVIKADKSLEPFDGRKLRSGIERALHKRPVEISEIDDMLERIQQDLRSRAQDKVRSSEICEIVMHCLGAIDPVAYIRFASAHRKFAEFKHGTGGPEIPLGSLNSESRQSQPELLLSFHHDELEDAEEE